MTPAVLKLARITFVSLAMMAPLEAQAPPPAGGLPGKIQYADGRTVAVTGFRGGPTGDRLPYTNKAGDLTADTRGLPTMRLTDLAQLDFEEPTTAELRQLTELQQPYPGKVRKSSVTFKDGTFFETTFIDTSAVEFQGPNGKGTLDDAAIQAVILGESRQR
jgi:hypothetical protein